MEEGWPGALAARRYDVSRPGVTARSRRTLASITSALAQDIRAAQRNVDIDQSADADRLACLVLAVLRGIEALGKAGTGSSQLQGIAETAIDLIPRASPASINRDRAAPTIPRRP
ncbi:hypothetical protein [Pengzhenrongella sicca]|uniref:TetR family transcriptional regulator n=1 Tax=Pengzhenrongella sicca TaxID=2819238 RepID=A0A8A4ZKK7_9MICO|nr:hypothetical protein [Pengzhenrongella sicca]QTE31057.1 hypothetical protein J4E96_09120 [Pengzhenrongella sicca]